MLPILLDGEDKTSPFKNCIRNNYRHTKKWAGRTLTNCFRIYDRDIKAYPVAIDFYDGRFLVQYFSNKRDIEPSMKLVELVETTLIALFGVRQKLIFWRTRIKRSKTEQYMKRGNSKEFFQVIENGVKFWVNLQNYLDSGLFLDHRQTRRMVALEAFEKRVLNLFAYTCSFSVHAALAGARSTTSVDMSNTYCHWGLQNFKLNAIPMDNHQVIRADCLKYLEEEILNGAKYDLIVIDPPTISRSKKMNQFFDIQLHYIEILLKAFQLLSEKGVIYFSTNSRKFVFDPSYFQGHRIIDISSQTIPQDFRSKKIHRCWKLFA